MTDTPRKDPKRGVISLRRLLKEIEDSREVMTREVYVAYDGLPYDWELSYQCFLETTLRTPGGVSTGALPTTGPEAWKAAEIVHGNFDGLSGVDPANRARGDLVERKWFEYLENKLAACDDTRKYVDKFVAHAADPNSRQGLTREQTGITLDRLADCHKAI